MTKSVDAAHVAAALVSLREPSVIVDRILHLMIGGRQVQPFVDRDRFRLANWMSSEIPAYTGDVKAVKVLAYRMGCSLRIEPLTNGYRAVIEKPMIGPVASADAAMLQAAGCAALLAFSFAARRRDGRGG